MKEVYGDFNCYAASASLYEMGAAEKLMAAAIDLTKEMQNAGKNAE